MVRNMDNIRIYGGDASAVFMADKGATAPVGVTVPATPWVELGWLSDTGLDAEQKADQKTFKGHQGGAVVKVSTSGAERMWSFECLEETAVVLGLVYPGSTSTTSGTGAAAYTTISVPETIKTLEKAWLFDEYDSIDGYLLRYRCPVGVVDPSSKVSHKIDDMTVYSFTVMSRGGFDVISNAPGFVTV